MTLGHHKTSLGPQGSLRALTPDGDRGLGRLVDAGRLFGQPSRAGMQDTLGEFVRGAGQSGKSDRLDPWEQFAQALLASNEFMWVD